MITAVHIEDETRNIELLAHLLNTHCSNMVRMAGNARNIPDAIKLIQKVNPQLVYLDIELNQGNAFELLEAIPGFQFQVIFITAFNDYAVKAFRCNAVDYLLKPISTSELMDATEKAVQRISQFNNNNQLMDALKLIRGNMGPQKIGIPVQDGVEYINIEDIIRCEAKGSYTLIYLINKKQVTATKSLKELEDLINNSNFVRVHNSWMINTRFLKKYYRGKNSYMEMEDGGIVNISVRKKTDFLTFFKEFD